MWLLELLCDVLPAFVALAKYVASDDKDAAKYRRHILKDTDYYLKFHADLFSLNVVVQNWDWATLPEEVTIYRILEVLESRFLKTSKLVEEDWNIGTEEPFPKLRALKRKLEIERDVKDMGGIELEVKSLAESVEDEESEKERLQRRQLTRYLDILKEVVHISTARDTDDRRERLFKRLKHSCSYLTNLRFPPEESPSSQLSISRYPSRHIRKLASSLYKLLQEHWRSPCNCSNPDSDENASSHAKREVQLSLVTHRRFDLLPAPGTAHGTDTDAKFEILLPTVSNYVTWQETEIHVKGQQCHPSLKFHNNHVDRDICQIMRDAAESPGCKIQMLVENKKLYPISVQRHVNIIQRSTFKTLDELLQKDRAKRATIISTCEGREKLILSFILATSLLHFHSAPWLQRSWNNRNICFLVNSRNEAVPGLTKPYLTAKCTPVACISQVAQPWYHFHRYPTILALGIMLLEISRGIRITDERRETELQDGIHVTASTDGLVALRVFEEWVQASERGVSKTIPLGLKSAIQACLEPAKIPFTNPPPSNEQIRQFILTDIVVPLGNALSDAYLVPPENLHFEISKARQPEQPPLFDSHDKMHTQEQVGTADKWFKRLRGIHDLLSEASNGDESNIAGRVTVAVLDTGFEPPDALMDTYQNFHRIRESKTWLSAEGENKGIPPDNWKIDLDGHGTHVADLLLRVAPIADVHIAQVFKTRKDLANPEIAAQVHQRIANAINYATIVWKVDIIIMSFGFESYVQVIQNALRNASNIYDKMDPTRTSTLIFAATRNDGANKGVAWPAKANEVIGISSTDGNGEFSSSFNPPHDRSDSVFYALGQAVEVVCPPRMGIGQGRQKNKTRLSGTSFANPIAAGLAANVLGYVKLAVASGATINDEVGAGDMLDRLRSKDGMKAIFKHRMNKNNDNELASLLPWDWLKRGGHTSNVILKEIWDTLSN
ncbi:uncharacterized protein PAC_17441 [Phialocephala subalpina]|uniref:Uncharacterized protein n=1 Tax=Phialocephala subalpina TaxID=576137 RepID=A0A1L7XR57_9HELO|nr:uncharacterized protein PAC_17441 [Phialocephala subalpina]